MHYTRWYRHGDPLTVHRVVDLGPPEERFWAKVDKSDPDGCWIWTASTFTDRNGYGKFNAAIPPVSNKTVYAHRFSYEMTNGPIPDGLFVLHKCDNPPCVNPAHLHLGTQADNMREMVERGRTKRLHDGCAVKGCDRRHDARGFCSKHYKQWRRHAILDTRH